MLKALIQTIFAMMLAYLSISAAMAEEGKQSLYLTNQSDTIICTIYITPDGQSAGPEFLSTQGLGCLQPGGGIYISYENLSECYVFIETFDENKDLFFSNGIDFCTQDELPIYSANNEKRSEFDSDENQEEGAVPSGDTQLGYIEIYNGSSQDICQVYFSSLDDNANEDDLVRYDAGNSNDCLAPEESRQIYYQLPTPSCDYQVTLETGFIELIFDEQVDLCTRNEISVSD
jgi:hypothetical protein